jgi:16S rRNA processing protein RimM
MKASNQNRLMSDELPVGRIAGVFGVHGELKCDPTRAGRALFRAGETLRAEFPQGEARNVSIASVREHKGRVLIRLNDAGSADEAECFSGATLYAARERIRLDSNEFFDADLAGCEVRDSGVPVGRVERVEHFPASDMLVVGGKFIPLIDEFVKAVDVESKRIDVVLPQGMLDE